MTLGEFIVENQGAFPYASGELSQLLSSIRLASKVVNREINKAGLADILGAMRKLAKGKSPGPDGVRSENLTDCQAPLLAELWRRIVTEGKMPRFLNDSLICPIHKKSDLKDPSNFRPISLLNKAIKLFEIAVLEKFKTSLLEKIPYEQCGLKPKYARWIKRMPNGTH